MCVYKELFLLFFSQHSYLHLHELFPFQIWREMMHFIYKKKGRKKNEEQKKEEEEQNQAGYVKQILDCVLLFYNAFK